MKKCKVCGISKKLSDFHVNKTYACGYSSKCKSCKNKIARDHRAKLKKPSTSKVLELSKQADALKPKIIKTTPEKQVSYKIILDENDSPKKEKKQLPNKSLTKRQKEVLEFIVEHINTNHLPPTYREIGEELGIKSTNGVSEHVNALIRKGYIERPQSDRNLARSLVLTKKCDKLIPKKEPVALALKLHGTIESILNRSKTVTISKDGKMTFWIDNSENK